MKASLDGDLKADLAIALEGNKEHTKEVERLSALNKTLGGELQAARTQLAAAEKLREEAAKTHAATREELSNVREELKTEQVSYTTRHFQASEVANWLQNDDSL